MTVRPFLGKNKTRHEEGNFLTGIGTGQRKRKRKCARDNRRGRPAIDADGQTTETGRKGFLVRTDVKAEAHVSVERCRLTECCITSSERRSSLATCSSILPHIDLPMKSRDVLPSPTPATLFQFSTGKCGAIHTTHCKSTRAAAFDRRRLDNHQTALVNGGTRSTLRGRPQCACRDGRSTDAAARSAFRTGFSLRLQPFGRGSHSPKRVVQRSTADTTGFLQEVLCD
jgi:hypothetical protein